MTATPRGSGDPFWRRHRFTVLLLAVLALTAYGGSAITPSLLGDEWAHVGLYVNHAHPCPNWPSDRPLDSCWLWFVFRTFDLNIGAHHALAVLVSFLSAVLLLIMLEQLAPHRTSLNGAIVALFLVYPTDFARTWAAGNITFAHGVFLAAGCLLAYFWRRGRWWAWFGGILMLCVTFGIYEVSVGLTIVMAVAFFAAGKDRSLIQRLALLSPAFVAVLFSVRRWLWQVSAGAVRGYSADNISFSPAVLVPRLVYGYRANLQWAWTDSVLRLLPSLATSDRFASVLSVVVLGGAILLAMLIVAALAGSRLQPRSLIESEVEPSDWFEVKTLVRTAVGGLVVLGAGFLPIILAVFPGLGYETSRVHHLPSIGAAIFVCAVLFGVARLLTCNPRRANAVALAGIMPLLMLGVASQVLMQQQVNRAWAEQKMIWNQMFELAPDIVEETNVVVFLTGYDGPAWGPGPFAIGGAWAFSSALDIFYGRDMLHGYFAYGSPGELLTYEEPNLVVSWYGEPSFAPDETVVFVYDSQSGVLTHLHTIEVEGQVIDLGPGRILYTPALGTEYRWLVQ